MADVGGAQTKHTLSLTVLESMMHLQGLPVHIEIDELSHNAILAGMRRAFEQQRPRATNWTFQSKVCKTLFTKMLLNTLPTVAGGGTILWTQITALLRGRLTVLFFSLTSEACSKKCLLTGDRTNATASWSTSAFRVTLTLDLDIQ